MTQHNILSMWSHHLLTFRELQALLRSGSITFAGNRKLKIYGTLHCAPGKRMKKENRVFFKSEIEAIQSGFRPCGHCLKKAYSAWKSRLAFKIKT